MDRLEATRFAGKVNQSAIAAAKRFAVAGMSLRGLDELIESHIRRSGCIPVFKGYKGYPASSCLSPNDVVVHGIPNEYRLKCGDILTIDVGCSYEGWMVDSARTIVIQDLTAYLQDPENVDPCKTQERLKYASEAVLEAQLSVIKEGCSLLDILKAAELASKTNFGSKADPSPKLNIFPQWGGHSIGRSLHEDPFIPNAIDPTLPSLKRRLLEMEYNNYKFEAGRIICLEPVVTFGKTDIITDEDGWTVRSADGSLVAHTEHCVLITETGYEILS